jgi:hypothetical protein
VQQLITQPGRYLTRTGKIVEIFEIKDSGATFNCHGDLLIPYKGRVLRKWNTWAADGRNTVFGDQSRDIVGVAAQ